MLFKQIPVEIDNDACSKCRICASLCECIRYDRENNLISINTISCKGCGICVSSCPSNALQHNFDRIFVLSEPKEIEPFDCTNCGYEFLEDKEKIIFCSRRLDMGNAIEAVFEGKKVVVRDCLLVEKTTKVDNEKIKKIKEILELFGIENKIKVGK
ncbi:MAG: 4Fe-4S binding protein [Thermoplasmata archaeon]|nr:4Fe-4S binding protein [Thermoplasmata archaeon]